jgi:hypothetical protein
MLVGVTVRKSFLQEVTTVATTAEEIIYRKILVFIVCRFNI